MSDSILIGTPVEKGGKYRKVRRLGESDELILKDQIKTLRNGNNNPRKQKPKRHQVFLKNQRCKRMDYIKRQGSLAPDEFVEKQSKSFLVENNQFRKHVFVDGSEKVVPKGLLMSGAEHNGAKKQGINTVFRPSRGTRENAGFILNANHINMR